MSTVARVTPEEIYPRVKAGASLLVCAYASDDTCRSLQLEGAINLSEFTARASQIPKDQEIIFYCA